MNVHQSRLQFLGHVFLSFGHPYHRKEGLSQGLKPVLWLACNVRAKARTYLRSKKQSSCKDKAHRVSESGLSVEVCGTWEVPHQEQNR